MKCFVAVKRVVDYSVKVRVNAAKNAVEIANVCVPLPFFLLVPFFYSLPSFSSLTP